MTGEEQQEVVATSDRLEAWRVERLQYLIRLAEILTLNPAAHTLALRRRDDPAWCAALPARSPRRACRHWSG